MSARAIPPSYLPAFGQASHIHNCILNGHLNRPYNRPQLGDFYDMSIELDTVCKVLNKVLENRSCY